MKKMLTMLLALLMLLTALPVQAEQMHNPIPQEILALFDVPAWDNYYIPTVTGSPNYYAFTKSTATAPASSSCARNASSAMSCACWKRRTASGASRPATMRPCPAAKWCPTSTAR